MSREEAGHVPGADSGGEGGWPRSSRTEQCALGPGPRRMDGPEMCQAKHSKAREWCEEDMKVGKQRLREAMKGYSYGWSPGVCRENG